MNNKAHRHSKRASNVDTNRAFKRVRLAQMAEPKPNRATRRAPLRQAHADALAADAATVAAAEAAQINQGEGS